MSVNVLDRLKAAAKASFAEAKMRTKSQVVVATCVALAAIGLGIVGGAWAGQRPKKRVNLNNAAATKQFGLAPYVAPPRALLTVSPYPETKGRTRELFVDLARSLEQVKAIPEARRQYFAYMVEKGLFIHGFSAHIMEAVPNGANGYIVTIHVYPDATMREQGRGVTSQDCLAERWDLTNGVWTCLDAAPAPHAVKGVIIG
jgi:hypothetical protein